MIFDYKLRDKVTIKVNKRNGKVVSLWIGKDNIKQYEVEYVDKMDAILSQWFNSDELSK